MTFVLILTSVILGLIAALHTAWAFEIWWPIRDERRLVAAVVGFREAVRMPGAIPCGLVAGAMLVMIVLLWVPDGWVRSVGLFASAAVLAVRGVLAYVPAWRRMTPQQPFARNDQLFYAPLCFALAGLILVGRA